MIDPGARQQFLRDYAIIRAAEGRGSTNQGYYRSLPYRDVSGRNVEQWQIRARSYRYFERCLLPTVESQFQRPLDVLDLGAGNGWMSFRLRERGHRAVALDIFCDSFDGLGALPNYPVPIPGIAAEFDALPVASTSVDLAIFNSSFHYSADYRLTLGEIRRCLRPEGSVVIMDTSLYCKHEHGELMRQERRAYFSRKYGFASDALGSVEFLDREELSNLAREMKMQLHCYEPWYGWRWALRPWRARMTGKRPPSRFVILTGRFLES
jgi:ubiquinone/menaquinone biosynthesis C-methylase UbiE